MRRKGEDEGKEDKAQEDEEITPKNKANTRLVYPTVVATES